VYILYIFKCLPVLHNLKGICKAMKEVLAKAQQG
jgi:hypothetical protein